MQGGLVKTRPLRPLEAARAFGMMLGGSIALAASAAGSIAAVARAFLSLRRPPPVALPGTAATALYAFVIRPAGLAPTGLIERWVVRRNGWR